MVASETRLSSSIRTTKFAYEFVCVGVGLFSIFSHWVKPIISLCCSHKGEQESFHRSWARDKRNRTTLNKSVGFNVVADWSMTLLYYLVICSFQISAPWLSMSDSVWTIWLQINISNIVGERGSWIFVQFKLVISRPMPHPSFRWNPVISFCRILLMMKVKHPTNKWRGTKTRHIFLLI